MYSTTLVFLSMLSAAFAFQVTRPTLTQGWTNNGPQTVSWDRVSTDATNFTILLTNTNRQLMASDVVIASFVDAVAASSISVSPPSGGWPAAGGSYRVNLVKSATELTSIYAQSTEFNITAGPATASSPSTGTSTARTGANTATTGTTGAGAANAAGGSSSGTSNGAATTSDVSSPSVFGDNNNSGASALSFSAGLLATAGALIGATLL
ncbi:hypothetical protein EST38_g7997 [Candolleomyces aberdarensis]|uniref:Yeast cell wall synthesis Kre9/Knh1-like N-terminal domain-containing protein n=1 Tax=Candolleomyces aberdarensis TaxID=2316362 RepID=A0A4Q2DFI1_9AGAR|nr:hypothetical protein EST38_g7997 [Candolleomyces aberdarensis]